MVDRKESRCMNEIIGCIKEAEKNGEVFSSEILTGFSGEKLVGSLQRLTKLLVDEDSCYLEVGVFQGKTLLSVAKANEEADVFGIDNFAFFDKDQKNEKLINKRKELLNCNNAYLINQDYEDALENLDQHIGEKKVSVFLLMDLMTIEAN